METKMVRPTMNGKTKIGDCYKKLQVIDKIVVNKEKLPVSWNDWSKEHEKDLLVMYDTTDEGELDEEPLTFLPKIDDQKQNQILQVIASAVVVIESGFDPET